MCHYAWGTVNLTQTSALTGTAVTPYRQMKPPVLQATRNMFAFQKHSWLRWFSKLTNIILQTNPPPTHWPQLRHLVTPIAAPIGHNTRLVNGSNLGHQQQLMRCHLIRRSIKYSKSVVTFALSQRLTIPVSYLYWTTCVLACPRWRSCIWIIWNRPSFKCTIGGISSQQQHRVLWRSISYLWYRLLILLWE